MSKVHTTSRARDTNVRDLVLTVFIQPNTASEGWWRRGPSLTLGPNFYNDMAP